MDKVVVNCSTGQAQTVPLTTQEVSAQQALATTFQQAEATQAAADSNAATLRDKARQSLTMNATFLARQSPTTAQVTAQVTALTRQVDALIRLIIAELSDISGT